MRQSYSEERQRAPSPDQLPLFTLRQLTPSRDAARPVRAIRSRYLEPALLMIARLGCVAQRQLARELWPPTNGGRQHARDVLRRAERLGLVRSVRLYPAKGKSSEVAYWLTAAGCRRLGMPEHRAGRQYADAAWARRRVQFVAVVQARADEGWKLVPPRAAVRWLLAWATHGDVRDERGLPVDNSVTTLVRRALSDPGMQKRVRLNALVRAREDRPAARPEVRIVVMDTPTRSACTALRQLASVVAGPPLELELVAEDDAALEKVTRQVRRAVRLRTKGKGGIRFHYRLAEPVPPFGTSHQRGLRAADRPLPPRVVDHPDLRPEPWEPWQRRLREVRATGRRSPTEDRG